MRPGIGRRRPVGQAGSDRGVRQGTWLGLSVALALMVTLGRAVPCRAAGLVIEAPNLTAAAGSGGSFDLLLVNTNPAGGIGYDIAADSFALSLAGPSSITFTDVSINTIVPYIYVTSGTTQGGGPLSPGPFPNAQFTAADSEFAAPGFRTVNPGETFGLAYVSYAVSPTSPLGTDTIALGGPATSLSDEDGNAIPFTISDGSIRVASAVPEPSALTEAAAAALIGLAWLGWRWRGRGGVARH